MDIITKLTKVLEERKKADPNMTYVKELYKNGTDKILKKIHQIIPTSKSIKSFIKSFLF